MRELLQKVRDGLAGPPPPPAATFHGPLPERFAVVLVRANQAAPQLSEDALRWMAGRLEAHGFHAGACNYGGLRCFAPHEHGSDDRCIATGLAGAPVYLRRYPSDVAALRRLIAVAHHSALGADVRPYAEPNGLAGYRSLAPSEEEIDPENVGAWYDALNPFAPSALMESRVQEVAAAWKELEAKRATDPKVARVTQPQYEFWLKFWADWQRGDKRQEAVNAVITDVNAARANALGIATQDDPNRLKNIALEEQSAAKGAAVAVDETASKYGVGAGQEWRILAVAGGAILAILLAAIGVRR